MKGPLDINRDLLAVGVPHEIVRLPRPIASAEELPEVLGLPSGSCVSVHMFAAEGALYALALPAGAPVRPSMLARALGVSAVRAADADTVNAVTDFCAPLVSPVSLPDSVRLVVDAALGLTDVLYAATGESGTVLKIRSHDLLVHTRALVATLTAPATVAVADILTPAGSVLHLAGDLATASAP